MPLVMEIEIPEGTEFVSGYTEELCRKRADEIYGEGKYKVVVITEQREALCLK